MGHYHPNFKVGLQSDLSSSWNRQIQNDEVFRLLCVPELDQLYRNVHRNPDLGGSHASLLQHVVHWEHCDGCDAADFDDGEPQNICKQKDRRDSILIWKIWFFFHSINSMEHKDINLSLFYQDHGNIRTWAPPLTQLQNTHLRHQHQCTNRPCLRFLKLLSIPPSPQSSATLNQSKSYLPIRWSWGYRQKIKNTRSSGKSRIP